MWRYDHDNRGSLLKIALDVGIFLQKTGIKNLNFSPHLYQSGSPTDLKGSWSWQHLFQLFLQSSHGRVCIYSYSYMYCCLAPSQVPRPMWVGEPDYICTRILGTPPGPAWDLLDFVLHALRALRPCDPRLHPSHANTITQANTITRANTSFFFLHFF